MNLQEAIALIQRVKLALVPAYNGGGYAPVFYIQDGAYKGPIKTVCTGCITEQRAGVDFDTLRGIQSGADIDPDTVCCEVCSEYVSAYETAAPKTIAEAVDAAIKRDPSLEAKFEALLKR